MTLPTVIVEIAFSTDPDDLNPVWADVTPFYRDSPAATITRGRADQISQTQPTAFSFALDNSDGRFTPGNANSPFFPNVKIGKRVRISTLHSSLLRRRATGFIDQWPVEWADASGTVATVTITASSRMARIGRHAELPSIVEVVYLDDDPVAYYPYGDPAGTTQAGNVAVSPQPPMTAVTEGTGGSITFGSATGPGTDELTAAQFSPTNATNGSFLRVVTPAPLVRTTDTSWSMECFFLTSTADEDLMRIDLSAGTGDVTVLAVVAGKLHAVSAPNLGATIYAITSAASVNNGVTHHALIRETISGGNLTATLYLDGVQAATATTAYPQFGQRNRLDAGGTTGSGFGMFAGTMSHVSVRSGAVELTAARIADHSASGLTGFSGESSAARFARLARYAGIPATDVTTAGTLSASLANQFTNGRQPIELMRQVETTEDGVIFDRGDGVLVLQGRGHRYGSVSQLTLATEVRATLTPRIDDQVLLNDLTVFRKGGVSSRAVDTDSIADYGLYRDSLELITTSDAEVIDAANWKVFTRSQPQVGIPNVEIELGVASVAQTEQILSREIGDRVTLINLPSQAPAESMEFFIEGISEEISTKRHVVRFNLSSAALSGVWILDDAVHSILGSTTRLAY